jgi:hypothetical protein
MPSPPVSSSAAASSASPALTMTLIGRPSMVAAGSCRTAANWARRFWLSAIRWSKPAVSARVGRTMTLPLSPSTRIVSCSLTLWRMSFNRPTTGTPIALATIVMWAVSEPSSSSTAFNRRRSYSRSSAGPRLRAISTVSRVSPV